MFSLSLSRLRVSPCAAARPRVARCVTFDSMCRRRWWRCEEGIKAFSHSEFLTIALRKEEEVVRMRSAESESRSRRRHDHWCSCINWILIAVIYSMSFILFTMSSLPFLFSAQRCASSSSAPAAAAEMLHSRHAATPLGAVQCSATRNRQKTTHSAALK